MFKCLSQVRAVKEFFKALDIPTTTDNKSEEIRHSSELFLYNIQTDKKETGEGGFRVAYSKIKSAGGIPGTGALVKVDRIITVPNTSQF